MVIFRCVKGPYAGKDFKTRPCKDGPPVFLGRSSGRKFRYGGVCLARDKEVSTTHATMEMKASGALYFVDTQSSNGSYLNGVAVEPNAEVRLRAGDELLLGNNSIFEVVFEYENATDD